MDKRNTTQEHALVFVKPEAQHAEAVARIASVLEERDVRIVKHLKCSGADIATRGVVEQQYSLLHEYAMNVKAAEVPLSRADKERFRGSFKVVLEDVVDARRIFNATDFARYLHVDSFTVNDLVARSTSSLRVRRGLHIHMIDRECTEDPQLQSLLQRPVYVINGFYPVMRERYEASAASTDVFIVEWDASRTSWKEFVVSIIGRPDPSLALATSVRGALFQNWQQLGLRAEPSAAANCVHVSRSAFESLAERMRWIRGSILYTDLLGSRLLSARFKTAQITAWLSDPVVRAEREAGRGAGVVREHLFDQLADMDSAQCIAHLRTCAP